MKKLSFLAFAVAGLLLGACSDKDVAEEKNGGIMEGKAEGFFKINLNLPTAPAVSTRAWAEDNDHLKDGLGKEYGVNSLILLLFDGATESAATLTQVINLTSPSMSEVTPNNPNQVTTKTEYVAKLNNAPSANLYALAVVNGKNNIEMSDVSHISLRGSVVPTATTTTTIADLQAALAESSSVTANDFIYTVSGTDYYFMTNAVLSNEKGGTTEPTTAAGNFHILAPVDKSFIYDTEAKATAGTAATDIYVERGMAKVTIASTSLGTTALSPKTGITLSASLDGWCLDITNKSSYVVRQVPSGNIWNLTSYGTATTDKYRFIGGNSVDVEYGTNKAGYRTYWALDPNYSSYLTFDADNKNTTNFSYADYSTDKTSAIGDNNPLYCFENTFDVARQDARYTTRAILGVKLTSTGTFYILGADRKTLYTLDDIEAQVLTTLKGISAFSDWYSTAGGGHDLTASDVTITWDKTTTQAGKMEVASVTIKGTAITAGSSASTDLTINSSTTTVDTKDLSNVISTLNAQLTNVEQFVDGVAYYAIRIKHFGDDLTPWNNGEFVTKPAETTAKGSTESDADYTARMIASIYPNDGSTATENRQDANYLGRYGMVRNNWYELIIGDILKVGSAVPPVIPSHPDDELDESYIKARINILSWAKRPQSWNLK